jgi:hypothetical protein
MYVSRAKIPAPMSANLTNALDMCSGSQHRLAHDASFIKAEATSSGSTQAPSSNAKLECFSYLFSVIFMGGVCWYKQLMECAHQAALLRKWHSLRGLQASHSCILCSDLSNENI